MAEMVIAIKAVQKVNTFIVCLNSEDPRIDENKQSYMTLLASMFGGDFYHHVLICFTKWAIDTRTAKERIKGRKLTESQIVSRSIEEFKGKLKITLERSQFSFIDNVCAAEDFEPTDPIEIEAFKDQLDKIKTFICDSGTYFCKDILLIEKQNNQLHMELLRQTAELRQKRTDFELLQKEVE